MHLQTAGTPALTSRGMKEEDIGQVTQFIHEGILLTQEIKAGHAASLRAEAAASGSDSPAKPTTKVHTHSLAHTHTHTHTLTLTHTLTHKHSGNPCHVSMQTGHINTI